MRHDLSSVTTLLRDALDILAIAAVEKSTTFHISVLYSVTKVCMLGDVLGIPKDLMYCRTP